MERACYRCERCGKPNGVQVLVTRNGTGGWNIDVLKRWDIYRRLSKSASHSLNVGILLDRILPKRQASSWWGGWHFPGLTYRLPCWNERVYLITAVVTVAHLNHEPWDNRPENLAALCQYCHLRHDAKHHYATARRTRATAQGQEWLSGLEEHIGYADQAGNSAGD
jgi:hypothetical protein